MNKTFSILFLSLLIIGSLSCSKQNPGKDEKSTQTQELTVGEPAPDFTLPDQTGKLISLSRFRGKKNVVVYFYPKDDTPGCTKEACSFRDDLAVFDSLNTVVLGISVDNPASHKAFTEKYDLTFTLLADTDKKVSKLYHTLSEKGYSKRHTFLVDKDGIIQKIYTKVDVTQHTGEIANFLKASLK